MQVFKTFMKIVSKKLNLALIYIIIFIIMGTLMSSNAVRNSEFEATSLDISVIDLDNSEASKKLTDYISNNNELVEIENDEDTILDSLYYRRVDIVLTINEGYSRNLSDNKIGNLFSIYQVPGSYTAELFNSQLEQHTKLVASYTASGLDINDAFFKTNELLSNQIKVKTLDFSENLNNDFNTAIKYYYQYLSYILMSVLIVVLAPSIIVMTDKNMRNRTNCSSFSTTKQMVQMTLGTTIFSVGIFILLTIVAIVLYGSQMLSSMGLFAMLNAFVFLIFVMILTILISQLTTNGKAVNMIANTISLGMSFLCGVFVPQELLSDKLLEFSKFLPAYWYIKANNMIAGAEGEILEKGKLMTYIGIEFAFSIAIFCVVLLVSRTKQKSKSI